MAYATSMSFAFSVVHPLTRVSMVLLEMRDCFGSNNLSLSATASEVGLDAGQVFVQSALICSVGRGRGRGRGGGGEGSKEF